MKTKANFIYVILLACLLIASVALNVKQHFERETSRKEMLSLLENRGQNKVIKEYVRDSIVHTVFQDRAISNEKTEKIAALNSDYADSLQAALKISIEKIEQVTKLNGKLLAELKLKTAKTDDGKDVKVHKDQYLDISFYPDTDSLKMQYNLELNQVRYAERNWLFGKSTHYIDVFSPDPRISIHGLKSFRIKERPSRRFGFGLSAGYGAFKNEKNIQLAPFIGVGVNYNLIEF